MTEHKPTGFVTRVLVVLVLGLLVPPWLVFMMSFVADHREEAEEVTIEDVLDAWCYPDCTRNY